MVSVDGRGLLPRKRDEWGSEPHSRSSYSNLLVVQEPMFEHLAIKISKKSSHHQHHHAAFVIVGGRIQSIGYNVGNTHAEIKALQQLWPSKRLGTKVYSFRWRKNGTMGMAKPCAKCESYMKAAGVKIVFYSDSEGQIQKMKL